MKEKKKSKKQRIVELEESLKKVEGMIIHHIQFKTNMESLHAELQKELNELKFSKEKK